MTLGFLDFESRSYVNLKTAGLDRYMTDAEPTIATWAIDNGPVHLWDMLYEPIPQSWVDFIFNPNIVFIAHNAAFDRAIMERRLLHLTPESRWHCTRAQAYAHGLPGGLDGLCKALDVPADFAKMIDGKRLIEFFCKPNSSGVFNDPKAHPDDWQMFKNYAMRDIDALRSCFRRLPTHNYRGDNLRYFWLDESINERGFAVDLPLVESATRVLAAAKGDADREVAARTGDKVQAVTQRNKLLAFLQEKHPELVKLRKSDIEDMLNRDDLDAESRFLLQLRLEGARASGAKYKRALEMHVDGRIRYTMQFSGAGATGRTAHKGFQPGNMPRAVTYNPEGKTLADKHTPMKARYIDEVVIPAIRAGECDPITTGGPFTACANTLRHTIVSRVGYVLVVADYRNIESVILSWLAGEDWKTKAFAAVFRGEGQDLYRLLYSRFFGRAIEGISDHERQAGKVIELACGFGGSVGAFVTMSVGYGIDLSTLPALVLGAADETAVGKGWRAWLRAFLLNDTYGLEPEVYVACHVLVQKYRAANPGIDGLKKALGRAVEHAIQMRDTLYEVGKLRVWANKDALIIELPSGRRLLYWHPKWNIEQVVDEEGEVEERGYVTYKRARGAKMITQRAWPGLFLENVVQATANDVLRAGSLEVEREFPGSIVLHVHDEIVCEVPEGTMTVEDLTRLMCKGWRWSEGLPLAAEGWTGGRYGKR